MQRLPYSQSLLWFIGVAAAVCVVAHPAAATAQIPRTIYKAPAKVVRAALNKHRVNKEFRQLLKKDRELRSFYRLEKKNQGTGHSAYLTSLFSTLFLAGSGLYTYALTQPSNFAAAIVGAFFGGTVALTSSGGILHFGDEWATARTQAKRKTIQRAISKGLSVGENARAYYGL